MAEALEQAVETVEPDTTTQPLSTEEAGVLPPEPEQTNAPAEAGNNDQHPPAALKGRYLIFPAMSLPELNSPTAPAFTVEDRKEPARNLFALVCSPVVPTATQTMFKIRNASISGLMPLIDFGSVFWSPSGQKCMVIIFERPMGGRFLDSFGKNPAHISEYEVGAKFVDQLIPALKRLEGMGLVHRAVRLENLYFMDEEQQELVFGECVSSPPGHDQPIVYESLERAMAMRSGRGTGTIEDDLYALGILLVFLLISKNPVQKLSDDEIIAGKSQEGSYQFLCSKERVPLQLIEVIRGLLADDPEERWTLESIGRWIEGQKPHITQRKSIVKARGPFEFMGREYYSPRIVAHVLSQNVSDAVKVVKKGTLEGWLRKSLEMSDLAEAISGLITFCKVHEGKPEASDDVFISKVCMLLDPQAPIRFKGFSFTPSGFGTAYAAEYLRKGSFQIQGEIIARDLFGYWASIQTSSNAETSEMLKTFNTLRSFAKLNEMGYGMERCLYELNRKLPCQGELLVHEFVDEIDDLLPTLDRISDETDKNARPIDKHIAAFIATHFNHDIQPHLKALCSPVENSSLIGLLSLYALVQWRQAHENLFGLSSWIGGLLQPAIGTYHSRTTQHAIEQEIPSLVRQGSLPDLFDLIDNADRRNSDALAFKQAQFNFSTTEAEIQSIVGEDVDQDQVALEAGEKATAMFAVVSAMIATTIIIFVMMM